MKVDKYTTERFVGIFDILGFKERVKEKSHDQIFKELLYIKSELRFNEEAAHEVKIAMEDKVPDIFSTIVEHLLFSDTIVLLCDAKQKGLKSISLESKILIGNCFMKGIPIKGCIAKGQVSYSKDNNIIFGRPIIDAYLLADEMKFMGVIYDKSCEEHFSNINDPISLVKYGKVPLKSGKLNHYYLDITTENTDKIKITVIDRVILKGIKKMYQDVNAGPRAYYDNTLELFYPNELK